MTKIDHEKLNRFEKARVDLDRLVNEATNPSSRVPNVRWKTERAVDEESRKPSIICPHCKVGLSSYKNLKRHIVKTHKIFKCPLCDEIITGLNRANHHAREMHGALLKKKKLEKNKSIKRKRKK